MYDSLYGLATRSTHPRLTQRTVKTGTSIYQPRPTSTPRNDHPAASYDSTDLSFPLRSSSCILRFNRPLPASNIELYLHDSIYASYPHRTSSCTHLRLDHTSYGHHPSSWRPKYNRHGLYTHVCKSDNKLSLLLYLLPRLCFLHCLWLSLLARFNLKHLQGWRAYRLRNSYFISWELKEYLLKKVCYQ